MARCREDHAPRRQADRFDIPGPANARGDVSRVKVCAEGEYESSSPATVLVKVPTTHDTARRHSDLYRNGKAATEEEFSARHHRGVLWQTG